MTVLPANLRFRILSGGEGGQPNTFARCPGRQPGAALRVLQLLPRGARHQRYPAMAAGLAAPRWTIAELLGILTALRKGDLNKGVAH